MNLTLTVPPFLSYFTVMGRVFYLELNFRKSIKHFHVAGGSVELNTSRGGRLSTFTIRARNQHSECGPP